MSENLYYKAKEKAEETARICEITDSGEIRKIITEELTKLTQEMSETLVDTLNCSGGGVHEAVLEGFLAGVNRSHRYLQGEFWSTMLKVIKKYGESEYFDARNEFAVKMCKRMAEAGENY